MIWRGRDQREEEPAARREREREQGDEEQARLSGDVEPRNTEPERRNSSIGTRVESVLEAAESAAAGIREDAQEWASRYLEESRRKADELANERIQEISTLTDTLISRARAVAKQSDELLSALDDAGRRMIDNSRPSGWVPRGSGAARRSGSAGSDSESSVTSSESEPSVTSSEGPPPVRSVEPAADPSPPPPPELGGPPAGPRPPSVARRSSPPTQVERPPYEQPPVPPRARPSSGRVSEGARLLATQMAVAGSSRDEISWRLREEFGIHDASAILDEIGI